MRTLLLFLSITLSTMATVWAADKPDASADDEKVDVEGIKKSYWARGQETQMGVVQNRLYSKEKKFQLALLAGATFSDPFLSVGQLGFSFGYHFNEYISVHALGWRYFTQDSTAGAYFRNDLGGVPPTNIPEYFLGGEVAGSLLYGKLSVVGKAIIYYDMHVLAGGGVTNTESGAYPTLSIGLGQQIYLNKWFALSIDYRLQWYREAMIEKAAINSLGQIYGHRDNWSHTVNFGLNTLWGF